MFTACNVGDEGGFAPNIQNNEEGKTLISSGYSFPIYVIYYCTQSFGHCSSMFICCVTYWLEFKTHCFFQSNLELYNWFEGPIEVANTFTDPTNISLRY